MSTKKSDSGKNARETTQDAERGGTAGPEGMPRNWMIPVILLLLRQWSSYGYDLMERMAAFGFAAMNPGSLYRALRQLEMDGMVSSAWDTSGQGPARRMYSITDAGEEYLQLWASGIEHYRAMMNTFFRLYTGQPEDTTDKR
ncbi:MAG TPA: poly-beta-hydroxybutyrate-responsive repressor [Ktedonobacterales bacterium]|nr:poly-beta-hydroxybutyrate-responsive repressor [Ktedonobacterales bacterium]